MPEPAEQGDQGSQVEQIANTPQEAADQPTIAKQSDKAPSFSPGVMDFLDIPRELQERLAPKAEAETLPESPTELPKPEPEPEIVKETPVEEEGEEEEEDESAAVAAEEQPQKVDKRQKRINRLTRQKNDLERQIDHVISENQQLRKAFEQRQEKAPKNQPPGLTSGKLDQIKAKIKECESMLEWCDDNPDGGLLGRGEQAVEVDAATARFYRRKAELDRQEFIVEKREQEWELNQKREQANSEASALWPEMFDRRTPEFQEAVQILQQYPFVQELPDANLIVGTFLEGRRKLRDKLNAAAKNGEPQKKHRDVDERVFTTPRVPIAPHTPEPLSREAAPSLNKRYNEAMSKLINDPDGGSGNVAAVFAAQEQARKTQPASRSQVRT